MKPHQYCPVPRSYFQRALAAGLLYIAWSAIASAQSEPPLPPQVVYCIDSGIGALEWDDSSAREAAVRFADALLPTKAWRSALIYPGIARMVLEHEPRPIAQRPEPPQLEASFSYALTHQAAGIPNPSVPIFRALDILENDHGGDKAIILIIGEPIQTATPSRLSDRLMDLAARAVPRCRLQGVRLFVAHRSVYPSITRLWEEMTTATGGDAAAIQSGKDLVTAVNDWAVQLSGLRHVGLSNTTTMSARPGQYYSFVFLQENTRADEMPARIQECRFELESPRDLSIMGDYGRIRVKALESDSHEIPVPSERLIRIYTGRKKEVTAHILPTLIDRVTPSAPMVLKVQTFPSANGTHLTFDSDAAAIVLPHNSKEPGKDLVTQSRLTEIPGEQLNEKAWQAVFPKLPPGHYDLILPVYYGATSTEYLKRNVMVFDRSIQSLIRRGAGGGQTNRVLLRADLNTEGFQKSTLYVALREGDGPFEYPEIPNTRGGRFEAQIAPDFSPGQSFKVAPGALAVRLADREEDRVASYFPGMMAQFPVRNILLPGMTASIAMTPPPPLPTTRAVAPTPPPQPTPPAPTPVVARPTPQPQATTVPEMNVKPTLIPTPIPAKPSPTPVVGDSSTPSGLNPTLILIAIIGGVALAMIGIIVFFGRQLGLFGNQDLELEIPAFPPDVDFYNPSDTEDDEASSEMAAEFKQPPTAPPPPQAKAEPAVAPPTAPEQTEKPKSTGSLFSMDDADEEDEDEDPRDEVEAPAEEPDVESDNSTGLNTDGLLDQSLLDSLFSEPGPVVADGEEKRAPDSDDAPSGSLDFSDDDMIAALAGEGYTEDDSQPPDERNLKIQTDAISADEDEEAEEAEPSKSLFDWSDAERDDDGDIKF